MALPGRRRAPGSRSAARLRALALGSAAAMALLVAIELGSYVVRDRARDVEETTEAFTEPDPTLGYRGRRSMVARSRLVKQGELLWDVEYTLDEHGRRATPQRTSEAVELALFLGDSFTFGLGVGDHETLPARFALLAPGFEVHNYGLIGYGPQHALLRLRDPALANELRVRPGIAVYTLIDAHLERAIGAPKVVAWAGRRFPCFELDELGGARWLGSFEQARPWRTRIDRWLGKSHALKLLDLDLARIDAADVELVARLLIAARDAFRERFASDRFYVMVYPESTVAARAVPMLERAGVRCFDYSGRLDMPFDQRFPRDGHPTPNAYAAVASQLAADLGVGTVSAVGRTESE